MYELWLRFHFMSNGPSNNIPALVQIMPWRRLDDKSLSEPMMVSFFKGSNMIVCALLVSNSRGCCLAAPGNHEGATIFSTVTNILLIKSNLKSPLPCHHVILVASIAVASTPGHENARASFCGRLSVRNRTAPDRRHLLPVATTKLIMRCV